MTRRTGALAEALRHSEKDRAENVMIVDVIRNDLGRIARPGSVRVDELFAIETYPTVHQMVSTVSADIGDASLDDVLRALFPCASITGAPKIRAMQIAQELELAPRGLYTGSIGHMYPGGDFEFNVAIRTVELDRQGHGRLGIGGGIVADSRPEQEYRECLDKARFLTDLPVGFQLIETLRLEVRSLPPARTATLRASPPRPLRWGSPATRRPSARPWCAGRPTWATRACSASASRWRRTVSVRSSMPPLRRYPSCLV